MAAAGLNEVTARVDAAISRSGRRPEDVKLVAVSKTVEADVIQELHKLGHRCFGENRAAELEAKRGELPGDIEWHFVGGLQSRKARSVAEHAAWIHSVDRMSLVKALGRVEPRPALLLQLNLAGEPQKGGATREEAPRLLEGATSLGLDVRGLMIMPPLVALADENRKWFELLRKTRDELAKDWPQLTELSMGMTDDFEVAIEEGATLIRVGRAIFGAQG